MPAQVSVAGPLALAAQAARSDPMRARARARGLHRSAPSFVSVARLSTEGAPSSGYLPRLRPREPQPQPSPPALFGGNGRPANEAGKNKQPALARDRGPALPLAPPAGASSAALGGRQWAALGGTGRPIAQVRRRPKQTASSREFGRIGRFGRAAPRGARGAGRASRPGLAASLRTRLGSARVKPRSRPICRQQPACRSRSVGHKGRQCCCCCCCLAVT